VETPHRGCSLVGKARGVIGLKDAGSIPAILIRSQTMKNNPTYSQIYKAFLPWIGVDPGHGECPLHEYCNFNCDECIFMTNGNCLGVDIINDEIVEGESEYLEILSQWGVTEDGLEDIYIRRVIENELNCED
jgi:hypothetical protein